MKYLFSSALLLLLFACGQAPEGEKVDAGDAITTEAAATADAISLAIDTTASIINWTGAKVIGKQHHGLIKLASGEVKVADGQLVGGEFVIDMHSINNQDMEGGGKARLEGHLKSDDFFAVDAFPTATFTIAEVKPHPEAATSDATHQITGNFTLRGITKSITIPARIAVNESGLEAKTLPFTIDRTQWNVMYDAGVLGTAQDDIINDEIGLQIDLRTL
ncbi:MAG: YceI family protein [Lewinella sp.]|nr:YceI family protein [Lewinella sp.]